MSIAEKIQKLAIAMEVELCWTPEECEEHATFEEAREAFLEEHLEEQKDPRHAEIEAMIENSDRFWDGVYQVLDNIVERGDLAEGEMEEMSINIKVREQK